MTATATPSAAVATRSALPTYLVAAEAVLAAVLMSYTLGRQSLWFDETATAALVHRSLWSAIRYAVANEPMTSLYLLVLRTWSLPFGESEVALRSFSVIFGVALVPAMYALTARLFTDRTALVAGLLTAVSATVVAEAQQARQYALVLLLVALATLCFVRAVEIGTQQSWLLYALVAAVAVYAQILVLFVVAGHALSLLALQKSDVRWRSVLVAAGGFTLAMIPLFAAILRRGGSGLDWIKPVTWARVQHTFEMFAGGTGYLLLAALVACAFAFRAALRTWAHSGRGIDAWRYTLLITWLFVPMIGILLVSFVRPLFVNRYMIGALPAFVILTAAGITAMRPRQLAAGYLVALVVLSAVVLVDWLGSDTTTAHTGVPREDWRGAVTYVLAHAGSGDAVVVQPRHLETAWEYYFRRHGSPRDAPVLALGGPFEDFADDQRVRSISERHDRVWLVMSHLNSKERRHVLANFGARYDHAARHRFTGRIDVLRHDARD
ncbi:MAG: glycosyltransferase family 39 protein [Acidimicrobiia bacterium]